MGFYENRKYTWIEIYTRCVKFASALTKIGIKKGDTVSFLAFNTPCFTFMSFVTRSASIATVSVNLDLNT